MELPDTECFRFIFEDRRPVVPAKIIWSRKECYHRWETSGGSFPVHAVPAYAISHDLHIDENEDLPSIEHVMGANNGQQAITLKEHAGRLVGEKVRDAAYVIVHEALRSFLLPKVLHWIGREDIAHETGCRWLTKAIELKEEPIRLGMYSLVP